MNLGKMRHRVDLQAPPDAAKNTLGEAGLDWTVVADRVPAAVETLSGRELFRESQVQADATHKVTIRFRRGVEDDMRVVWRGRFLNVYRVDNPGGMDDELQLFCSEQR